MCWGSVGSPAQCSPPGQVPGWLQGAGMVELLGCSRGGSACWSRGLFGVCCARMGLARHCLPARNLELGFDSLLWPRDLSGAAQGRLAPGLEVHEPLLWVGLWRWR